MKVLKIETMTLIVSMMHLVISRETCFRLRFWYSSDIAL